MKHKFTRIQDKEVDGAKVTLWRDLTLSYFVGRVPDDRLEKIPLGAFVTLDAARAFADHAFPGGDWHDALFEEKYF